VNGPGSGLPSAGPRTYHGRMPAASRRAVGALVVLAFLLAAPASPATAPPSTDPPAAAADPPDAVVRLSEPFGRWLEEVDLLIAEAEREAFLALAADYQRRAFVEAFWRVRDPYPETARNELRERWEEHAAEARQRFDDLGDPRSRVFLANGEPAEVFPARCGALLQPVEIWHYRGSALIRGDFFVVFLPRGERRWELWQPGQGLGRLLAGVVGAAGDRELLELVQRECIQGSHLVEAFTHTADWARIEREGEAFPDPGEEWLHTFLTYSTEVPEDAATFPAELTVSFPGVRGGRTVVQGAVAVPREAARPEPAGGDSYDFLVDGEVLRRDELFEHFRYRFRLPAAEVTGDSVPLLFQRYLRPGAYRLLLRVEELSTGRYFRHESTLEVPFVRPGEALQAAGPGAGAPGGAEPAAAATDPTAEANRALSRGDVRVRLLPPPQGLQVDNTRVEAEVEGQGVGRVLFELDGRPVMSKARPPYSVELDLGDQPRSHEVTAVVLDTEGEELARDEMLLNAGPHRFSVRLVEPQPGRRYERSLRAAAEVDVPEGDVLERVELFLDETRVATLYQPPFVQPVLLPPSEGTRYVRAVAYLADGNHAEDVVLVNAPDQVDRLDVHFVELYTSVQDRRGRPVEGLAAADFTVREDGVEQAVRRFELVRDVPIYAGVLLDTSSSMAEEMDDALAAASRFFDTVITPKDRAAVITFNHAPELAVRFTADPEVLAGGLSGLGAAGGTALHDSLIYALYYFSGVQGKRALVLISDGDDQGSRYSFEEALDYARRTGVAIYAIGLGSAGTDAIVRSKLMRLAAETGGQWFAVGRALELAKIYGKIEEELRTQYLLAYQSSQDGGDGEFRQVEIEVAVPGAQAKTIRGYYP
jgi:VWFA-related protein